MEIAKRLIRLFPQGKGKSTKEILRRIDYGGSITLMMAVGSMKRLCGQISIIFLRWDLAYSF